VRLAAGSVTFGDVPLASLRRSHVERWVKAIQTAPHGESKRAGLAPGSIRSRLNSVHAGAPKPGKPGPGRRDQRTAVPRPLRRGETTRRERTLKA
jgi:hypothetical protein